MKPAPWFNLGLAGALALVSGCGGGMKSQPSVTAATLANASEATPATNAVAAPSVIYITDFYLPPSMIQSSPAGVGGRDGPVSRLREDVKALRGEDPAAKARKIVTLLGEAITRELNKTGYRAEYRPGRSGLREDFFPSDAVLPREGWLLGGWFEQVQEGDPAKQATVGFGTGSGKVSVEVIVSDLAGDPRRPFLCIGSENARHRMPGGLVTMNPYVMAAKFVLARGETERDVKAMGSAIAQSLVQYIQRGASPAAQP